MPVLASLVFLTATSSESVISKQNLFWKFHFLPFHEISIFLFEKNERKKES